MEAVKKWNLPIYVIPSSSPSLRKSGSPQPPPSPRIKSPQGVLPHLHSRLFPQFQWRALRLEGSVPRGFIFDSLFSLSFILC